MLKFDISLLSTNQLLETRIKDLRLELPIKYQEQIKKIYNLLERKNILWRPHLWASEEWFSPDGIDGIAYPFTLCHPKLIQLEKMYLGECEGNTDSAFFKLLAHETGHAIDNAFRLRLKKQRQKIFGLSSKSYPKSYRPKTNSQNHVQFLNDFYAQAHPDEDWAETFAVWLTTDNWKSKYKETKAIKKLEYMNEVMMSLRLISNYKVSRKSYRNSKNDTRTVRQYLEEKQKSLRLNRPNFYATKLQTHLFSRQGISVSHFITKQQKELVSNSKKDKWITQRCLKELKQECKKKNYKIKYDQQKSQQFILRLIEDNYDDFIKQGRTRVYM